MNRSSVYLLASLCWTARLVAQEPSPDDLLDLKATLDRPIAAASKRLQRVKEAPADATVINGAELQELGYRTLADALQGVMGFRSNRDRAYAGLGVRGLYVLGDQNTRVLILLDGHALNGPAEVGSSKVGEDFGIPLDFVERIEIIRGPASSLYGNGAFLGMVNVVTRPRADRVTAETALHGADNHTLGLDAQVGGPLQTGGWNLMVSGFKRDGTETRYPELQAAPFPASLDAESRQSAYLQLKGRDWSFAGYAVKRDQDLSSAPFASQLGGPFLYRNQLAFADLRLEPSFGPVKTLFRAFADWNQFSTVYSYDGLRLPGVEGVDREKDPDRGLGLEAQARMPLADQFFLTVGSEQQWHRYHGVTGVVPDQVRTEVAFQVGNTYLQTEWQVTDALDAVAGLQLATWALQSGFVDPGLRAAIPSGSQTGLTPRFSLIWRPTGVDILKLLYGGGYRNPTIFERYYNDGASFQDNPTLRPERIDTLQGIWASLWPLGLRSQLSGAVSHWRRLIQPTALPNGFQQFQNQDAELHGRALEGEVQGDWPGWSAYLQAGLYDWSQDGAEVPNTAKTQGAFRVTRRWERWSASVEAQHVGSRANPLNGTVVPGSTLFRTSLRRDWKGGWLRLSLEELGSRRQDLVATDYDPIQKMTSDGAVVRLTLNLRL